MNQSGFSRDSLDALIYTLIHSACWKNLKTATARTWIPKSADCFCPFSGQRSCIQRMTPKKTHHLKVCKANKSGNKWELQNLQAATRRAELSTFLMQMNGWWKYDEDLGGKLRILWLCFGFYSSAQKSSTKGPCDNRQVLQNRPQHSL